MAATEEQVERCDLCGTSLPPDSGSPGCLHCLLAGGRDDAIERRFQHYEVTFLDDNITPLELGRGAMGITYRALDLNLGAPVALKVIGARYSNQREARERFRREARIAARLRHPNVASVYHYGETAEGQSFYAMELVEGETLEARVRREGPLGTGVTLEIALQVARALFAAEKHGLVHRDLKPSNLMLVPNESSNDGTPEVKVIDFGLAKAIDREGEEQDSTLTTFAGTPGFASPEQLQAGTQTLDTRADIYSLGATLWYALTTEIPRPGTSLPLAELRRRKIPRPVIRLLGRTLATAAADRPPSARALLGELEACRAAVAAAPRRRRLLQFTAVAFVLLLLVAVGLTSKGPRHQSKPAVLPADKSIAVLPFENLSTDKENAYFASGVQDEILSDLAKVADLKVISRTSVISYPSAAGRNLREIARALGVSHIVEGSVQRAGDRIRVTAQLIDARTDNHLWAEHYDRTLTDIFAVESEIAQQIADQLQSKLSPGEKSAIVEKPTSDLNAYELYTEARAINVWESWQGADAALTRKSRLLRQAAARDPNFALAYSSLAKTECDLSDFSKAETHLRAAKEAAEAALRSTRNQPESHREMARYYLLIADRAHARAEIAIAQQALPNDSETLRILGQINADDDRPDEAVANLERAFDLDPRNDEVQYHLCALYEDTRRYREWEAHLARVTASNSPQSYWFQLSWAELKMDTGDLTGAQTFLDQIPMNFSPTFEIWYKRMAAALYARDYNSYTHIIALIPRKFESEISVAVRPNTSREGWIAHYRGDENAARAIFSAALKQIENPPSQRWDKDQLLVDAAICDAGLGLKEKAIGEARRAVDLSPAEKNFRNHVWHLYILAKVYAWLGEKELALDQLEVITKLPTGPSYGALMFDPCWDSIRNEPRFEKIVAAIKPGLEVAELSPMKTPAIEQVPTNLSASELYAEAREINYWEDWQGVKNSLEKKAVLLREAIRRDPSYALAYCALVKTECDLAQDTSDPTRPSSGRSENGDRRVARAKTESGRGASGIRSLLFLHGKEAGWSPGRVSYGAADLA